MGKRSIRYCKKAHANYNGKQSVSYYMIWAAVRWQNKLKGKWVKVDNWSDGNSAEILIT